MTTTRRDGRVARTVTCANCGALHDARMWTTLALHTHLAFDDVRDLVTIWPWSRSVVVEVRTCTCGSPLARSCKIAVPLNVSNAASFSK